MQTVEPALDLASELPNVTQSKYFSPAFNAAIFDGPVRIYFAQYQEAEALKVYFRLQEQFKFDQNQLKGVLKENGAHVFVMLYPTQDIFERSFDELEGVQRIASANLSKDVIIGINGLVQEEDYDVILEEMKSVFSPISN